MRHGGFCDVLFCFRLGKGGDGVEPGALIRPEPPLLNTSPDATSTTHHIPSHHITHLYITHTHTHAHHQVAHVLQNGDMYGQSPGAVRAEDMTHEAWDYVFLGG